jgi:broad specificity phosphatase PhoE
VTDETTDETIADPAPRRVLLIRHAEATEGDKDVDRGRHLTELGKLQADALARRAARWQLDAIFCSDMYRACETAAAISVHHPDAVCTVDPVFREVSTGKVERELDSPDGALRARLDAAWEKVVTMPHPLTVIITHNGLIKYFMSRTLRWDSELKPRFHSAHTGITALSLRTKGRAALQFFNDTRHLTPELVADEKRPWLEDPVTGRWRFGLSPLFTGCVDAGEGPVAAIGEQLLCLLSGVGL